jgi:hypothetical protein
MGARACSARPEVMGAPVLVWPLAVLPLRAHWIPFKFSRAQYGLRGPHVSACAQRFGFGESVFDAAIAIAIRIETIPWPLCERINLLNPPDATLHLVTQGRYYLFPLELG